LCNMQAVVSRLQDEKRKSLNSVADPFRGAIKEFGSIVDASELHLMDVWTFDMTNVSENKVWHEPSCPRATIVL